MSNNLFQASSTLESCSMMVLRRSLEIVPYIHCNTTALRRSQSSGSVSFSEGEFIVIILGCKNQSIYLLYVQFRISRQCNRRFSYLKLINDCKWSIYCERCMWLLDKNLDNRNHWAHLNKAVAETWLVLPEIEFYLSRIQPCMICMSMIHIAKI